ncbi:MAG TPA: hypothetical protein VEA38_07010 [Terriglobales bacterium]|nr:hypothetical protein [Terriglobales bacterium]
MSAPDALGPRLEELERLIHEMEQGPESPARERARGIVRAVLDLHAGALARMMELVGRESSSVRDALAADPLVASVLLLHGLHPVGLEARVRAAIDELAPVLRGQGGHVTVIAVADGAVRLRLERDHARPVVPIAGLRATVERAVLAAAPDATAVDVEAPDADAVAAFVPLEQVRLRARASEGHPA